MCSRPRPSPAAAWVLAAVRAWPVSRAFKGPLRGGLHGAHVAQQPWVITVTLHSPDSVRPSDPPLHASRTRRCLAVTSDCLVALSVAVVVTAIVDYYRCYREQETEGEEGSDFLGSCGSGEGGNSLMVLVTAEPALYPAPASFGSQSQVDSPEHAVGAPRPLAYYRDCAHTTHRPRFSSLVAPGPRV